MFALASACGSGAEDATYLYAGGGSGIDRFRLDRATGALSFESETAAGDRAYLAGIDPDHRHVYVQTQLGLPVVIRAFDVADDGALAMAGELSLPHPFVEGMTQLLVDPTAGWLLMSSTGGASGLLDQLVPLDDGRPGTPRIISSDFYGFA